MAEIYVILIVGGRRTIDTIPQKIVPAVRKAAKKKIGQYVNGVLLAEELYLELFGE